jgi:hypothetical protein
MQFSSAFIAAFAALAVAAPAPIVKTPKLATRNGVDVGTRYATHVEARQRPNIRQVSVVISQDGREISGTTGTPFLVNRTPTTTIRFERSGRLPPNREVGCQVRRENDSNVLFGSGEDRDRAADLEGTEPLSVSCNLVA